MAIDALKLRAELGLDTEEFDEKLIDSKNEAESSGGVIGGIFDGIANVAKVSAAAIAGVSAAIGGIAVQATKAYADYEQLVGGVETLFGAGGRSLDEFLKDEGDTEAARKRYDALIEAQDTVIANANEAYRTAGMSANEYMETVTSFSASLLQSLDGDTQAAADAADQAIIDMADNANKMGTSMESIQNAYQGFAKQNYTMLDNLKLGYGGTKEEMERLLADAEKLSGVKYDISSLSDVYDAIHVVQTEMGITGTTAKEAASTISGSLAMTKASWENLITAMGSGEGLDDAFDALVESAETFAGNAIPVFTRAIEGISQVIGQLGPIIAAELPGMINSFLPSLIDAASSVVAGLASSLPSLIVTILPSLLDGITMVMNALVAEIPNAIAKLIAIIPDIISAGVQIVDGLVSGISQSLPRVANTFINILPEINQILIDVFNQIMTMLPGLIDEVGPLLISLISTNISLLADALPQMLGAFVNAAPAIIDALTEIMNQVLAVLPGLLNQLIVMIPTFIDGIITTLSAAAPSLLNAGLKLFTGLVDALPTVITLLLNELPKLITQVVNFIVSSIPDLVNAIITVINTLATELPAIIQTIVDALPETLDSIIEGILLLVEAIIENLPEIIQALVDAMPTIINALVDGIADSAELMVDAGFQLMMGLIDAIPMIIDALVPMIPEIVMTIAAVLVQNGWRILNSVNDILTDVMNGIFDALDGLSAALGEAVVQILKIFVEPVGKMFTGLWDGIKEAFGAVGEWFSGIFTDAWNAITEVFNFDTVTEFFVGVWDTIEEAWDGLANSIGGIFKQAWSNIKSAFSTVGSWFGKLGTTIADAISGAIKAGINALFGLMEKVLNGAIDLINGIIKAANKIPYVDIKEISHVDLPELARGGVVDDPTVALIGEAGAEAVVPLENNTQWINKIADQLASALNKTSFSSDDEYGSGFVQNLTINAPEALDPSEVERLTRMANQDMLLAMGR